jgi:tyrosyl-tRNA synthetase
MAISTDAQKISKLLSHRVDRVVGDLEARLKSGKPLRIKLGVDPTSPDLHLGHAVQLKKLREFQALGHKVVLIIGDYTSLIGDPTGKSKTRPPLTKKEVDANAKTYMAQAGKILDLKKAEVRKNGEWLGKLKFADVLKLASLFTVARMIERDDFAKRLAAGTEVHLHELLYPMMQAQDSVAIEADVEIGGTDQMFNILAGRELQKKLGLLEQCCMFMGPLLVGTDGVKKMSKSLGNYVDLTDAPDEMFGKVMSIPDGVLRDWLTLTTDVSATEVEALLATGKNPRDAKIRLAKEIIAQYHSSKAADSAEQNFIKTFQKKEVPDDVPELSLASGKHSLIDLLIAAKFASSKGEARRVIEEGGVRVAGEVVKDIAATVTVSKTPLLIQKGKRHFVNVKAK